MPYALGYKQTADKSSSLRGAGDEAISCNRNRLPRSARNERERMDRLILQNYDVDCLWLQAIINSAHGNAMGKDTPPTP
ncbi:MAG: hypothetical protein ACK5IQ_02810 [Bacteroidales bacterium]